MATETYNIRTLRDNDGVWTAPKTVVKAVIGLSSSLQGVKDWTSSQLSALSTLYMGINAVSLTDVSTGVKQITVKDTSVSVYTKAQSDAVFARRGADTPSNYATVHTTVLYDGPNDEYYYIHGAEAYGDDTPDDAHTIALLSDVYTKAQSDAKYALVNGSSSKNFAADNLAVYGDLLLVSSGIDFYTEGPYLSLVPEVKTDPTVGGTLVLPNENGTLATREWVLENGADLSGYLPLTGGTLTGKLTLPTWPNAYSDASLLFGSAARIGTSSSNLLGIYSSGSLVLRPNGSTSLGVAVSSTEFTYNNNAVWHAGNLTPARKYQYTDSASSNTRYVKVRISNTAAWMGSFTVKLYADYQVLTFEVSGYNYTSANGWYGPKVNGILNTSTVTPTEFIYGYDGKQELWFALQVRRLTKISIQNFNGNLLKEDTDFSCTMFADYDALVADGGTIQGTLTIYDITRTSHVLNNASYAGSESALAAGYESYSGMASGNSAYPYVAFSLVTPETLTYNGEDVTLIQMGKGATVTFTLNGEEMSVKNPYSSYFAYLAIVADDGLILSGTGHPYNNVRVYSSDGLFCSAWNGGAGSVTDLDGGYKQFIVRGLTSQNTYDITSGKLRILKASDSATRVATGALSLGYRSMALGTYTASFGYYSVAMGAYSSAFGNNAVASNTSALALGSQSVASAAYSVALGYRSVASGNYAVSAGTGSVASGENSVALNYNAQATGAAAVAIGYNAKSTSSYGVAIGISATVTGNYSVGIGRFVTTSRASQVVLGTYNEDVAGAVVFGIGTSASARKNGMVLSADGDLTVARKIVLGNTASTAELKFSRGGANYVSTPASGTINFVMGGKSLNVANSDVIIASGAVTVNGTLTATGAVTVGGLTVNGKVGGDLSPTSGGLYNLGETGYRWNTLYAMSADLTGTLHLRNGDYSVALRAPALEGTVDLTLPAQNGATLATLDDINTIQDVYTKAQSDAKYALLSGSSTQAFQTAALGVYGTLTLVNTGIGFYTQGAPLSLVAATKTDPTVGYTLTLPQETGIVATREWVQANFAALNS